MAAPYLLGMYEKAIPAELSWLERLEAARASVEQDTSEADETCDSFQELIERLR